MQVVITMICCRKDAFQLAFYHVKGTLDVRRKDENSFQGEIH